jgi:hypothetical protein
VKSLSIVKFIPNQTDKIDDGGRSQGIQQSKAYISFIRSDIRKNRRRGRHKICHGQFFIIIHPGKWSGGSFQRIEGFAKHILGIGIRGQAGFDLFQAGDVTGFSNRNGQRIP